MTFRIVLFSAAVAALLAVGLCPVASAQDETKKEAAAESTQTEPTTPQEPVTPSEEMPGMESAPTTPSKQAATPAVPKEKADKEMSYLEWMLR